MLRIASLAAAACVAMTAAIAQDWGMTGQRQDLMRQVADTARGPMAMIKGDRAFDLAEVQAALKWFEVSAIRLKDMFPAGSAPQGSSKALPVIWETLPDFLSRFDKLARDARAAQAAIKDEAGFASAYLKVMRNCVNCHRQYMDPP